ncbi:MAG: glycosyltransferase [Bryobacteraceae bacterium]|nr:glycosyltransferase [Bryobacteraceae bacterium]
MKILQLHNRYRRAGGEDAVVAAEAALLAGRGHDVRQVMFDNDASSGRSILGDLGLAAGAVWNRESHHRIRQVCREFRPDVAHVHNFWMRMSPSVYAACGEESVPVVQTLHNYRLICPNAMLLRGGAPCTDCVGRLPWRGVAYRCYRHSYAASLTAALTISLQNARDAAPDLYVALTENSRQFFIRGGLPAHRICVKPNFVHDPGPPQSSPSQSNTVVFVGRLDEEKGVQVLLDSWLQGGCDELGALHIAGEGPLRLLLESQVASHGLKNVTFLGQLHAGEVKRLLASSRCLVFPSLWHEPFGLTITEAYAAGRPVVAFKIGAPSELVRQDATGLLAPAADTAALASSLRRMLGDGDLCDRLGTCARTVYLEEYSPDRNYLRLADIYQQAAAAAHAS